MIFYYLPSLFYLDFPKKKIEHFRIILAELKMLQEQGLRRDLGKHILRNASEWYTELAGYIFPLCA